MGTNEQKGEELMQRLRECTSQLEIMRRQIDDLSIEISLTLQAFRRLSEAAIAVDELRKAGAL